MTPPTEQLQSPLDEDDELSLYDIWQKVVEGWRWIVGGIAAGVIAAAGYLTVTPPQYEAMALVQIGQAPGPNGPNGPTGPVLVETPSRVVERIMFPTFKDGMVRKLGWSDDARGAVYAASLAAKPAKAADLIELKVRGLTREEAASSLAATIEYLAALHKAIAKPAIDNLQADLKAISDELGQAEKALAELKHAAQLQKQLPPHDRFSQSVLYEQLWATGESRAMELRRRETQYRGWISSTGTVATAAFAEPSVPQAPVSPKQMQVMMLGALGGLFLSLAAMMFQRRWQSRRAAGKSLVNG
ncbi:MAG: Wzz/FepE/Etk N-terminal domain-containing protein [Sulfuritalea sp.]|jgi:uncharacterized protein involved in exopolysaccharide biosynthesis|nr:Wzz/FepE/Etk N-terminal domain-containing protein [Sulfuritalea sp.]